MLEVFDPPMCCSSGVCGPKVDPVLPKFAADLEWLRTQGITVKRYNLAQQPLAFAENEIVRTALTGDENCLPLVLVDGQIVFRGQYPSRQELAGFAGIQVERETAACGTQKACGGGPAEGKTSSNFCG